MKAIGYARVSTAGQTDSGLGLDAQQSALESAAARMKIELVAVFRDEGLSGSLALDSRPGLISAIDALKAEDVLLIAKRDRLARDPIVSAMVERLVERKGARIVSALEEAANGDDPSNVLMRRLLDAFGEFERLLVSSRTKAALRAKRLVRGERMGNPPYGYRVRDGKLVAFDPELRVIRGIRRARKAGRSVRQIVELMGAEKIRSRRGTPIQEGQVYAILRRLEAARVATEGRAQRRVSS